MFIVQRDFIRPSTDVPFFEGSTEYKNAWDVYRLNGKIIGHRISISADRLTKTIITAWKDEESWQEYCNDPAIVAMIEDRTNHLTSNNIITRRETKQV